MELYCDRTKTEWKMKTNGGDENVNEDDNVYCAIGKYSLSLNQSNRCFLSENCRIDFCRSCENDQNKYYCPKGIGK